MVTVPLPKSARPKLLQFFMAVLQENAPSGFSNWEVTDLHITGIYEEPSGIQYPLVVHPQVELHYQTIGNVWDIYLTWNVRIKGRPPVEERQYITESIRYTWRAHGEA